MYSSVCKKWLLIPVSLLIIAGLEAISGSKQGQRHSYYSIIPRLNSALELSESLMKNHLLKVFKRNRYEEKQFDKAVAKARKGPCTRQLEEERGTKICLAYIKGTTGLLAKILKKGIINVTYFPPNTISRMLDSAKDPSNPKLYKEFTRFS